MAFIGRLGSQEVAVPATQSITVSCYGASPAKVYYGTKAADGTFVYVLQATVTGVSTFGPFAGGQQVRVEAPAGADIEYAVAVAPQLTQANPGAMPTIQMGVGQRVLVSATNAITAFAGGGQASAVLLTSDINRITTVGTAADSVKMPPAVPGMTVTVSNAAAANSMNLFPATGEAINALAANAAFAIAANKTAELTCAVAGQWHALLTA